MAIRFRNGRRALRAFLVLLALGWGAQAQAAIDLGVTLTGPAGTTYTPGTDGGTYTLVVSNAGSTSDTPTVQVTVSAGITGVWTCSDDAEADCAAGFSVGTGGFTHSGSSVDENGVLTFTYNVGAIPADFSGGLKISATVTDGSDPAVVDEASVTRTMDRETDFSVALTPAHAAATPGEYTPGEQDVVLSIVVRNDGPSDPGGNRTVNMSLPAGATATWSCSPADRCSTPGASWTGSATVDLDAGEEVTIKLLVDYASSMSADPITYTATVAQTDDPDTADNSAASHFERHRIADFGVAFDTDHSTVHGSYTPGTDGATFTVTVTNDGPSDSSGTLQLTLPFITITEPDPDLDVLLVEDVDWNCPSVTAPATSPCTPASGTDVDEHIAIDLDLAQGESVAIDFTVDYASGLVEPMLSYRASIASDDEDLVASNDTATNYYDIARQADVAVVKLSRFSDADEGMSALRSINPGTDFFYDIRVTNNGPSDVGQVAGESGVLLFDDLPQGLGANGNECAAGAVQPCWEYCPGEDTDADNVIDLDECLEPVTGSGDIDTSLVVLAGQTRIVRVHASIASGAPRFVDNTAKVSLVTPDPGNDTAVEELTPGTGASSTARLEVESSSDIAVSKTDFVLSATPGTRHSYEVQVSNGGFITINDVQLSDAMPLSTSGSAGFVPGTISWQCEAFGGACCNHNSSQCGIGAPTAPVFTDALVDHGVDLPGASRVEFTISGDIAPEASGTLVNEATVTLPPDYADLDETNNSARDDDTVLTSDAGLAVSKALLSLTGTEAPFALAYEIIVTNAGPSYASNVAVTDTLDVNTLDAASASWSCVASGAGSHCDAASGTGSIDTTVDLGVGGSARFALQVNTTADVTGQISNTATANLPGQPPVGSTAISGLAGESDLAIDKTDNREEEIAGKETEYVITVTNDGPDDVFGARITDLLPPQLEDVSWTCEATTPIPGDLLSPQPIGDPTDVAGHALAISGEGRHVYLAATDAGALFVFDREHIPGATFGRVALMEAEREGINDAADPGPAVTGMTRPIDVAISSDNGMVYVLSAAVPEGDPGGPVATSVAAFTRSADPAAPTWGRLEFAGSTFRKEGDEVEPELPLQARRIAVSGEHLYVSGDESVSVFRLDPNSGLPTWQATHTTQLPDAPGAMAVSLSEDLLFVGSSTGNSLAMFAINQDGAAAGELAHVDDLANAAFQQVDDLALAPALQQVYVAAAGAESVTRVGYGGAVLQAGLSDIYDASALHLGTGVGAMRLALAPDGEHLLVSSRGLGAVSSMRRDPVSGSLDFDTLLQSNPPPTSPPVANPHASLAAASDVVITPDGRHALVASAKGVGGKAMTVYARRAPDPVFALIELDRQGDLPGPVDGLVSPADVALTSDGQHLYAVSLEDHALVAFRRHPSQGLAEGTLGGHLQFLEAHFGGEGGVAGLTDAYRILVSPDDRSVFVTSELGNSLAVFDRDDDPESPTFGTLTFREVWIDQGDPAAGTGTGNATALLGATGMAMDSASLHLYVAARSERAIGIFQRDPVTGSLSFIGEARGGIAGVTKMQNIQDLALSADGDQLFGVSFGDHALVVFNRTRQAGPGNGLLQFVQARLVGAQQPSSISLPQGDGDDPHIYIAAQGSDELVVMRRVTDATSPLFGQVQPLFEYQDFPGLPGSGPRDIRVAPNGKRVYVVGQHSDSVLIFDRDLNASSASFGGLVPVEVRTDSVDGLDGLENPYALVVSGDSRNIYVAGFGDQALTSFVAGTGSSCSAGGSGALDDLADIGAKGTVQYRIRARIRADATGVLTNTARVTPPERTDDPDDGEDGFTEESDDTTIRSEGDLTVTKTNSQVSVVAGETVTYEVVVRNPGPSNVGQHGAPVTVSDLLAAEDGFVPEQAQWTCLASNSGALEFIDAHFDQAPVALDDALGGVSDLALVPDPDGDGALPSLLAATSVLDDSLTLFTRGALDGRLLAAVRVVQGDVLNQPVTALDGARAVAASPDGRFVYVASRVSDAVSVFALTDAGGGTPALSLVDVEQGTPGLDQAVHLVLSPDGSTLYVAGANDNAIAMFERDAVTGALLWLDTIDNGASSAAGTVAGLGGVQFLVPSPDGAQLYALSSSGASIARFDVNGDGTLAWRGVQFAQHLNGLSLAGASSAVFDSSGTHLYVTATDADSVVVLQRETTAGSGFGALSGSSSVSHGLADSFGLRTPRRLALSADGAHLYVSSQGGNAVSWFARDAITGSLRYLGQRSNDSAGVSGLAGATGLVLDDTRGQLYAAGTLDHAVVQFQRQTDSFCPASGSGPLEAVPVRIGAGGSVSFSIQVPVSAVLPPGLTTVVNEVTVQSAEDPNSANNEASDTDQQQRSADLRISKDDGLAEYDGLAGAAAIAGDGKHVYVAGAADNAIGIFQRTGSGAGASIAFAEVLKAGPAAPGLAAVADVLLSADGAHVYAVSPADNSISAFRRDPLSGALELIEVHRNEVFGVTGLSGARALAQSADGAHVYVLGGFSNAVVSFARDTDPDSPGYGSLAFMGMLQHGVAGVDGMLAPVALALSGDGKHVYVLGGEEDTIAVFARIPTPGSSSFGQLSFLRAYRNETAEATGLAGARSLALDASGTQLYVLATDEGSLVRFARNPDDGLLTFQDEIREGDTVTGLAGASRLRLAADGGSLYVAGGAAAAVVHFSVAPDGALAWAGRIGNGDAVAAGGQVLGLDGASDVLVSADGEQLYVASATDAALTTLVREPASGSLTYLAVLFDGLGGVAPGDDVIYVIRVENLGPSQVQARVVDSFPAAFTAVNWTCSFSGEGAGCRAGDEGNIDEEVTLPVGGQVTFQATGRVGEDASGRLVNTATVAAIGASDPVIANNSATDDDTVLSVAADLVVDVDDGSATAVPGARVDYTVTVANVGPSYATDVRIADAIPAALLDVSWSCAASPVAGVLAPGPVVLAANAPFGSLAISPLGTFAYAVGGDSLVAYRRSPLDGTLQELAVYSNGIDGVDGIAGAADLALSPDGRYVFVAGAASDAVAVFERDAATGLLEFVAAYRDGDPGIDGLGGARALALAPGGGLLYVAGQLDDAIALFEVGTGGALLPHSVVSQNQQGMDGLNRVSDIALSADATHLYAVATDNESLSAFARAADGALTRVDTVLNFSLGDDVLLGATALHVHGTQIFVAATQGDRVSRFRHDDDGFALDWSIAAGSGGVTGLDAPSGLAFDPEQARLYVASSGNLHLFSLLRDTPEQLAQYPLATFPEVGGVAGVLLSADARQLYSFGGETTASVAVWSRERGSRCALDGIRELEGQLADIAPGGQVAFQVSGLLYPNASGELVYSASAATRQDGEELNPADNADTDTDTLTPQPDLAALKTDGLTEVVAGTGLSWRIDLANAGVSDALGAQLLDPAPVFPAAAAGIVAGSGSYSCAANAPLAPGARTFSPGLQGVADMAVSVDGRWFYAVNPQQDALLVFPRALNGSLGAPTTIVDGQDLGGSSVDGLDGASSVAVTPDGRQLLVTGAADDSITVFAIAADGSLSHLHTLVSGTHAFGILGAGHAVVSRDGTRVFVAGTDADSIAWFARDAGEGTLAYVGRVRDANEGITPDSNVIKRVRRLHLSDDGLRLYAVSTVSEAVSSFAVDPASGMLTYLGKRSTETGVAGLQGARDIVGAPGDDSLYVLAETSIHLMRPDAGGALQATQRYDATAAMAAGRALALDASGSRLYLADAAGAVHVFARDWTDGTLDLRGSHVDPDLPVAAGALLWTGGSDLYVAAAEQGRVERLEEQALSRCLAAPGASDALELPMELGVGGWGVVDFAATVHPSARGVLRNSATFLPVDGNDPALPDNTAQDATTIIVVSDLSVSKQGPAQAVAGESVEYRILVDNAGPSSALGMRVVDVLSSALPVASWTCTATEGSTCAAASGSGDLDLAADLLPGGQLDIRIVAQVDPAFLGTLPNAVSLVPEVDATDPTPDDHGDDTSTEVSAEVELSVGKSNGGDGVVAGAPTTYTIIVANAGPSDAPSVSLTDTLADALTEASWTCSGTGAATCPAAGNGDIDATISVPAGEQVQFELTATVDAAARGVVENSAVAAILDAALERTPGDETATDSDAIEVRTGMSVQLLAATDPFDPASAQALAITALVGNAGPSLARDTELQLLFSAPVQLTMPSGCTVQGPSTARCMLAELAVGDSRAIAFGVRGLPAAPGVFTTTATLVPSEFDPAAGDNLVARDILLQTGADVVVAIDNDSEQLIPGRAVSYVIDVANVGSVDLAGVQVDVPLAAELLGAQWSCSASPGAACTASGSGGIAETVDLGAGQALRYRLDAVVDPSLDPTVPRMLAQTVTATVAGGADMNPLNNTAVDEDVVFYIIFSDGFEQPLLPAGKRGSDRLSQRECAWLKVAPGECPAGQGGR